MSGPGGGISEVKSGAFRPVAEDVLGAKLLTLSDSCRSSMLADPKENRLDSLAGELTTDMAAPEKGSRFWPVASARRPATPQTIPVASIGTSRRSRVIGIRISSFEPRRILLSSSSECMLGSSVKRGSKRFSSNSDAAGSAGVKVSDKNRGWSTKRAVVSAFRRMAAEDSVSPSR